MAVVLTALLGCRSAGEVPAGGVGGPSQPVPPGPAQVRQALDELGDKIVRDFARGWPEHVTLSRDFEELPLVEAAPVEDRGGIACDLRRLGQILEAAVREQGYLRLLADELAVPPSLRDDPGADRPPAAGLRLAAWVDATGSFHLELVDVVAGRVLLRGRSRP